MIHTQQHLPAMLHLVLCHIHTLVPQEQRQRPIVPAHKACVALALQGASLCIWLICEAPSNAIEHRRPCNSHPLLIVFHCVFQGKLVSVVGVRFYVQQRSELCEAYGALRRIY